jgi:hypothetical protein
MNIIFHPEAKKEFFASIAYYEDNVDGLGEDFHDEIFAAAQNAFQHPDLWPDIGEGIRRCLIHRFPYAVLYEITTSGLFIYAIMNLNRHPDYWKYRLPDKKAIKMKLR